MGTVGVISHSTSERKRLPRADPATSRAPPAAMERAAADHPGWTESGPNHGFPEILKNHDFHRKIQVAKSIGGTVVGHPGHAYATGNGSRRHL